MKWQNGWQSWEANPGVTLQVYHWESSRTGKKALVTAGIHGDEYEGPAAVAKFVQELDPSQIAGSITAIPVANPPAFEAATRLSPDGLNLARCFPGNSSGKPTEQLAAAIFEHLVKGVDYLIDLHSGGTEYLFLPVSGFYGDPSPDNPSFEAARHFGLPALWKLPETDGVLSREAYRIGAVAIGNEYLGAGQLSREGGDAYAQGILRCLKAWRIHDGEPAPLSKQAILFGDWQLASQTGIFQSMVSLGEHVTEGQCIATITGPSGAVLESFRAAAGGVVGALRSKAFVREGNWGVMVLQEKHVD